MDQVYCPKCGQPMRKRAISEVQSNGKRIVVYVCPNRWGCGIISHKTE